MKVKTKAKAKKPFHPGEILKELYLDPLGLTQAELAGHLQCTRVALNEILNAKRGISPRMACRLADVLSTTPELWMNLQTAYDLWQAKTEHQPLKPFKRAS